ncbi:uncharacterized protein LOC128473745 [Spea bombifrons]|uniref:uncharacterized protein LOC128473745 n=1 Tax=Spea bombifrons TaxID=233779 RepID=UPI0023493ED5|nr:uncharacterized protein LOC128473745 [Spea bombifrons]
MLFTKNTAYSSKADSCSQQRGWMHTEKGPINHKMKAAESDGSHNISVSLLKSVLKEREVKINDLSQILKRERTEKLRLIEEKEQLLAEIETLRNEFQVMTFDKERKKQDAFNSFDPNSPVVLQKEIVNLKSQINDLQEANESAVIELSKADEEISQNKKDMARLKADYNQKLEDSHEEIKLLKEKINQIPNICCHTEDNDDGLLREISQLRSECRRLRTHSHQLSEQNHHLQEEMWDIKRRYESLLKRATCFPNGQNNGESAGPHTDLYNKGSFSKDWISEENSLYRNDAFKVDGTFSKCKAVLGSPNIKEPWESKHEERFTNNASPFSMDSENTDLLVGGYHEDSPHKPSQTGMGGETGNTFFNHSSVLIGSYEPKALNDNDLFSVKNKDSTPWNSPHQSPKAAAARASFCKLVGNTRMNLSVLTRRPFAPKTADDLKVGNLVKFSRPAGKISKGTIQYKGYLRGREEIYLGVELEGNEVGKHDGTFQGARYFLCKPNKGVFVNFNKIIMAWE